MRRNIACFLRHRRLNSHTICFCHSKIISVACYFMLRKLSAAWLCICYSALFADRLELSPIFDNFTILSESVVLVICRRSVHKLISHVAQLTIRGGCQFSFVEASLPYPHSIRAHWTDRNYAVWFKYDRWSGDALDAFADDFTYSKRTAGSVSVKNCSGAASNQLKPWFEKSLQNVQIIFRAFLESFDLPRVLVWMFLKQRMIRLMKMPICNSIDCL